MQVQVISADVEKQATNRRKTRTFSDALLGFDSLDDRGEPNSLGMLQLWPSGGNIIDQQQSTTQESSKLWDQNNSTEPLVAQKWKEANEKEVGPLLQVFSTERYRTTMMSTKKNESVIHKVRNMESAEVNQTGQQQQQQQPPQDDMIVCSTEYARLNQLLAETMERLQATKKRSREAVMEVFCSHLQSDEEFFVMWEILLNLVVIGETQSRSPQQQLIEFFAQKSLLPLLTFLDTTKEPSSSSLSSLRKSTMAALVVLDHLCSTVQGHDLLLIAPQLMDSAMPRIANLLVRSNEKRTVLAQQASDTFCSLCHTIASSVLQQRQRQKHEKDSAQELADRLWGQIEGLLPAVIQCHENWLGPHGDDNAKYFNQIAEHNPDTSPVKKDYRSHFRRAVLADWMNIVQSRLRLEEQIPGYQEGGDTDTTKACLVVLLCKTILGVEAHESRPEGMGGLKSTVSSSTHRQKHKSREILEQFLTLVDTCKKDKQVSSTIEELELACTDRLVLREVVAWLGQKQRNVESLAGICQEEEEDLVKLVLQILSKTNVEGPTASLVFCLL